MSRVQVYGEKDADGFYWGEAGPRQGFVPCNMVSEVQVGGAVLLRDNLILLARVQGVTLARCRRVTA